MIQPPKTPILPHWPLYKSAVNVGTMERAFCCIAGIVPLGGGFELEPDPVQRSIQLIIMDVFTLFIGIAQNRFFHNSSNSRLVRHGLLVYSRRVKSFKNAREGPARKVEESL